MQTVRRRAVVRRQPLCFRTYVVMFFAQDLRRVFRFFARAEHLFRPNARIEGQERVVAAKICLARYFV